MQSLQGANAIHVLHAAECKAHDHESCGHWACVLCSCMPANHKAIPAVWAVKCKSRPDGTLLKHNAHLCAGSHQQVYEVNYLETYSPAVQWVTVWLLLIPASVENLHTCHVDFVLA